MTEADTIQQGGGSRGIERQHKLGRLTARERLDTLVDKGSPIFECGLFAGWNMYTEYGGAPGAGVVTAIATVGGKLSMIIANDATVKAGAFFPMTCKKIIRAQTIAHRARLPLLYLVDSAGVFLPLQEDVFPDTDDFGRIDPGKAEGDDFFSYRDAQTVEGFSGGEGGTAGHVGKSSVCPDEGHEFANPIFRTADGPVDPFFSQDYRS